MSVRILIAALSIVVLTASMACDSRTNQPPGSPTAPQPPPAEPSPAVTLSGAVFEVGEGGSRRPINARQLHIEVEVPTPTDPSRGGWTPIGADGRYRLTVPDRRFVKITFVDTGERHRLCATNTVTNGDTELDALVYSAGASLPSPTLRGQVYKIIDGRRMAVPGADVYFRTRAYGPDAFDFADADGRFVLCGIPPGRGELYMFCANDVQAYARRVDIQLDTVIDIDASAFHDCLWSGLTPLARRRAWIPDPWTSP